MGSPLHEFFFFRQILLFFEQRNLDSLSMFLRFINYSTLTTDQRIQPTLMQNLFENVHTVKEDDGFPVHVFSPYPLEFLSYTAELT